MQAQYHGGNAFTLDGAQPKRSGNRHPGEGVGGIEFAMDYFIANSGPAQFAMEFHLKPMFFKKSQLTRHEQRSAIVEGHESEAQYGVVFISL